MTKVNVENFLDISIALSKEKDYNKLLYRILKEAMDMTQSDAGTLYTYCDNHLEFKIMITKSMGIYRGIKGEKFDIPPVPMNRKNVCACAAMENRLINLDDVYCCAEYDFSGPREYDALTGYKTTSMLVVPMENHGGGIIGVLQLINAIDNNGKITSFDKNYEEAILSLSSLAAVSIANMNHLHDVKELFESFVRVMSKAIDERTPYNGMHTRNMAKYGRHFLEYINDMHSKGKTKYYFDENTQSQLMMSIWMHDIGKLTVPLEIMNKSSRLEKRIDGIRSRFEKFSLMNRIKFLEGGITKDEYEKQGNELKDICGFVEKVNAAGFLTDEVLEKINKLKNLEFEYQGQKYAFFTPDELENMSIRKGTLTDKERKIMEGHVVETRKLLEEIKFSNEYKNVIEQASNHHEFLDGSGYPMHISDGTINTSVRVITILDIFDALTSCDRPYKKAASPERAIAILKSMAEEGKLDENLLKLFSESGAWEK